MRNGSLMIQDFLIVQFYDFIYIFSPELYGNIFLFFEPELSRFQKYRYQTVELVYFFFGEIIFGNINVFLPYHESFPTCESHVWFVFISTSNDNFGCSLHRYCIEEFILSFRKEYLSRFIGTIVVATQNKEISELLIEPLFTGSNVTNSRQ